MADYIGNSEIDRMLDEGQESDDSDADPDFEVYSDHDSNSECDISEGEQESMEPEANSSHDFDEPQAIASTSSADDGTATSESGTPSRFYLGRDKKTKWRKTCYPRNVRTRTHNLVSMHLPGSVRAAMQVDNPIDSWNLFFNEPLIDLIVESTNIYIDSIKQNYTSDPNMARLTDIIEIKAYFGLLYIAGALHGSKMNIEQFWSTDGTGIEIFRAAMSLKRFRFLTRCLRFDNIHTRGERKARDNLAALRSLLDMFVSNCNKYFTPSENVTLDEMLVPYRGRCRFRMYIPNKPAKYGIKIFILACSKTYYVKHLEIYAGAQPDGPYKISNKADDVVFRLVEPVAGSGRNLTMDNWFNSYNVVKTLRQQKNLTVVGTLKKNKPQIPAQFLANKKHEQHSSTFGFQEDVTLVSYVPKRNKCVLLLSSMHDDDEIDNDTGEMRKPSIITYYNKTKGGVDVCDAMCGEYTVARGTKRWPLCLFYAILNIAALNGYIVLNSNLQTFKRSDYLKTLGRSLIQPHMALRANKQNLPREIRSVASRLSGIESSPRADPQPGKRGRCHKCKDAKTNFFASLVKCGCA